MVGPREGFVGVRGGGRCLVYISNFEHPPKDARPLPVTAMTNGKTTKALLLQLPLGVAHRQQANASTVPAEYPSPPSQIPHDRPEHPLLLQPQHPTRQLHPLPVGYLVNLTPSGLANLTGPSPNPHGLVFCYVMRPFAVELSTPRASPDDATPPWRP